MCKRRETRNAHSNLLSNLRSRQYGGDVRNATQVADAVRGQELIIHLAYMIPPAVDEHLEEARAINVDGTLNIIGAAQQASLRPKLFFGSSEAEKVVRYAIVII